MFLTFIFTFPDYLPSFRIISCISFMHGKDPFPDTNPCSCKISNVFCLSLGHPHLKLAMSSVYH